EQDVEIHVRCAVRNRSSGIGLPPEVDRGTSCTATSVSAKRGGQIVLRRARACGRRESTAGLGGPRSGLIPRPLHRSRPNQRRRSAAVGPTSVNVERSLMAIGWQVPANWWTRDHNLCIATSWITVARALGVDYRKVETQGPVKFVALTPNSDDLITSRCSIFDGSPENTVRLRCTRKRGARLFETTRRGKGSRTERELFFLGPLPRSREGNNPSAPPSVVARRFNAARDGGTLRPQRNLCVKLGGLAPGDIYVFCEMWKRRRFLSALCTMKGIAKGVGELQA
ncbi:hypothetical protein THAOC_11084, partial [Thalassiosira oceanica]